MHLQDLSALGADLEGGVFAGLTTKPDGTHCAVVLLADKPGGKLTWQEAVEWAQGLQAELPSRPVSALLFANARDQFEKAWHWTGEANEDDGSFAWTQYFHDGSQLSLPKSYEGRARAVRLIPHRRLILQSFRGPMTITLNDHRGALLAAANAFADACTAEGIRRTSGIELQPGERYAGVLLNEDGTPSHHVVLRPGDAEDVAWPAAIEWAKQAGGELPNRREQALLFANAKSAFEAAWYWSGEERKGGSYAWNQGFNYGDQLITHKSYEGRARAVRRVTA